MFFIIENYHCTDLRITVIMKMDHLEKNFAQLDVYHKKSLNFNQFESFINDTYKVVIDDEIDGVFKDLNIDKSVQISLKMFKRLVNEFQDRYLKKVFKSYDENNDNLINTEEMYKKLKRLDSKIEEHHISAFINKYDTDGDGCVNFNEFKSMTSPK